MLKKLQNTPLLVFAMWIALILGCAGPSERSSVNSNGSTSAANAAPELELLSFNGERGYSYLTVNGQVRNISGKKMEGVWAVVEFYDNQGSMITSEDGIIEYNPLMPGQTSPFKVMQRDNPLISTFKVNFKYTFGTPIAHKDSTALQAPANTKRKRK